MAENLMESLPETEHLSKSFSCSKHNVTSGGNLLGKDQEALNVYGSGDMLSKKGLYIV